MIVVSKTYRFNSQYILREDTYQFRWRTVGLSKAVVKISSIHHDACVDLRIPSQRPQKYVTSAKPASVRPQSAIRVGHFESPDCMGKSVSDTSEPAPFYSIPHDHRPKASLSLHGGSMSSHDVVSEIPSLMRAQSSLRQHADSSGALHELLMI
jgi:hypothetical protein